MSADKSLLSLFNQALDRENSDERFGFLDEACGQDSNLRKRLQELLLAHDQAGGFLSRPYDELDGSPGTESEGSPVPPKPVPTAVASLDQPEQIGRYKLLEKIGEGGCGIVYMAEQQEPVRRSVALKVIKLGMDTKQVVARFDAERQALALMDHQHIARVLDAGATQTGRPYFVMELVQGIRITNYCEQKAIPPRERLELFLQVCSAIQHAHQKGIIHRDLKPSNILVTTVEGKPQSKVIDFGIAKATNNQRLTDQTLFTAADQFIGTPAYMSPEQAEIGGVDIDTRTDIYSLGVVLYELLTGTTPFDTKELLAKGLDEMRRTIREVEPIRPSTRLTRLSAVPSADSGKSKIQNPKSKIHNDLDWVVMKCLEKDRCRRYETANALAADIRHHLQSEPVTARPPSAAYRFQKLVRRHKVVFAATVAVTLALLVGVVASAYESVRVARANLKAQEELWKARLAQARALRLSHEPARKFKGLEALSAAGRARSSPELINEAIAHLALLDFGPGKTFALPPTVAGRAVFDRALERLATWALDGTVTLWQLAGSRPIQQWQVQEPSEFLRFSADGRFLYLRKSSGVGVLLDTMRGGLLREIPRSDPFVAFCPQSRRYLALASGGTEAVVRNLTNATPLLRIQAAPGRQFLPVGASHSTASLFAIVEGASVSVWNWDSGQRVDSLDCDGTINAVALEGDWLAAAGVKRILLLNRETGQRPEISAHAGTIDWLCFLGGGELLMSAGWDGNRFIWQPDGTQVLKTQSGLPKQLAPEGDRLAFVSYSTYGWWEVSRPSGRCDLPPPCGPDSASFSPDGKLLVAWRPNWLAVYEVASGRRLQSPPESSQFLRAEFLPDSRALVVANDGGVRFWFAERERDSNGLALRWSGPESVAIPEQLPYKRAAPLALTSGRKDLALPMRDQPGVILMRLGETSSAVRFLGLVNPTTFALSPDSRWMATGNFHGGGPCIWNAQTGEPVKEMAQENRATYFSPDGRALLIAGTENYSFLEPGTWRELHRAGTGSGGAVPACAAWSGDGRLLAVTENGRQVQLLDGRTWQPLAVLTSPHDTLISHLSFNHDGSRLAVCRQESPLELWDLPELCSALGKLGLSLHLPN